MLSDLILKEIQRHVREPNLEMESRLGYAKGLLNGFQMIFRTSYEKDFARNLDYTLINKEELTWVIAELYEIPTTDYGYDEEAITKEMLLRDMVLRKAYHMDTLGDAKSIPAVRCEEVYF